MNRTTLAMLALLPTISGAIPAFPGAEGYGAQTPGGRGGKVLFVTNLGPSGPGSLRQALVMTTGPRIIVFKVSGVILGQGEMYIQAENLSYVTLAGQTSPGGITITTNSGTPVWQEAPDDNARYFHDAIWRFLRFRCGSANDHAFHQGRSYNWIVDHCDFSGGTDECVDIGLVRNFTIQWSTIANSGPTGQVYGLLVTSYGSVNYPLQHMTFHHNLFAHHKDRCGPAMHWAGQPAPDNGMVDYRNNVHYNSSTYMVGIGSTTPPVYVNMAGNYFKAGPQSGMDGYGESGIIGKIQLFVCTVYDSDNYFSFQDRPIGVRSIAGRCQQTVSTPWTMPPVATEGSLNGFNSVMAGVGAFPRDSMNMRTVRDVLNGTGQLSKTDDPRITSGPAWPSDADNDGMPDFWEDGMGLNRNDSSDQRLDRDGDGYSNVEEYINDLALARLCQDYHNSVYPIPSTWPDYNPSCCRSLAAEKRLPAAVSGGRGYGPDGIYDLLGRRVAAPSQSGIYLYRAHGRIVKRAHLR